MKHKLECRKGTISFIQLPLIGFPIFTQSGEYQPTLQSCHPNAEIIGEMTNEYISFDCRGFFSQFLPEHKNETAKQAEYRLRECLIFDGIELPENCKFLVIIEEKDKFGYAEESLSF